MSKTIFATLYLTVEIPNVEITVKDGQREEAARERVFDLLKQNVRCLPELGDVQQDSMEFSVQPAIQAETPVVRYLNGEFVSIEQEAMKSQSLGG